MAEGLSQGRRKVVLKEAAHSSDVCYVLLTLNKMRIL